jgi:hypothetical protein
MARIYREKEFMYEEVKEWENTRMVAGEDVGPANEKLLDSIKQLEEQGEVEIAKLDARTKEMIELVNFLKFRKFLT